MGVLLVLVAVEGVTILQQPRQCGWDPSEKAWTFGVAALDVTQLDNGTVVFRGEVAVSGSTGSPRVEDVVVHFLDESNRTLARVRIGDFGIDAQFERNLTVRLETVPHRVRLETGTVSAGDGTTWTIVGLLRSPNGGYGEYVQRTNPTPTACANG